MEDIQTPHVKAERTLRLEKIASVILMATAFLLPIFFIPTGLFSIPFAKSILLYGGVLLTLIVFLFSVLETGKIKVPMSPIFLAAFFIPVIFLFSSLASTSVLPSLTGYGIEVGTFAFRRSAPYRRETYREQR